MNTVKSDGTSASYYELPAGCTQLQDLISHRNMNAQNGEIFRSIYRNALASHSDELRDARKVLFYAQAEVDRLLKLRLPKCIMPNPVTGNWPTTEDWDDGELRTDRIASSHGDGERYDELDMSDPANWRDGDLVTCIESSDGGGYSKGSIYTISGYYPVDGYISSARIMTCLDDKGSTNNAWLANKFKFHSRPVSEEIIQDGIVTKAPGDVFIQTEDGETARYSAAGYAASKE